MVAARRRCGLSRLLAGELVGHGPGPSGLERNAHEYEVSDPSGGRTRLYFMNVPEPKTVKNRLHIDITTDGSLEDGVARLVAMGGKPSRCARIRRRSRTPTWAVMQDPEGNEFCVFNVDSVTGLA